MNYEQVSHDPRSVRLGLSESLEDYAERQGMTIRDARWFWRADGAHLLSSKAEDTEHVAYDGLRVAPGVAVPVRMNGQTLRPHDVIEVE